MKKIALSVQLRFIAGKIQFTVIPAKAGTQIPHTGVCDLGTSLRWHDVF
jgi:hypothetical protein